VIFESLILEFVTRLRVGIKNEGVKSLCLKALARKERTRNGRKKISKN